MNEAIAVIAERVRELEDQYHEMSPRPSRSVVKVRLDEVRELLVRAQLAIDQKEFLAAVCDE